MDNALNLIKNWAVEHGRIRNVKKQKVQQRTRDVGSGVPQRNVQTLCAWTAMFLTVSARHEFEKSQLVSRGGKTSWNRYSIDVI